MREALSAANLGLLQLGDPQAADGVVNAVYFEPRATMTVALATVAELTGGTEAVIETVNVEPA